MGSLALAMVLVIALSSRSPSKPAPPGPAPAAETSKPDPRGIDDYRRAIEQEMERLRQQQQRVAAEQLAIDPLRNAALNGGAPVSQQLSFENYPHSERNWVDDRQKREDQARHASNVALSKRRPDSSPAATASATPLPSSVVPQQGATENLKTYRVPEGTVLEAALVNRLDSSFAGPLDALITTNVYSTDRTKLLIPQGSRILGSVTRVDAMNQQRLAVTFDRLLLPGGQPVDLENQTGLSQQGETGLLDKVNHHYGQIFGIAITLGAIAGLNQANTNYGPNVSAADVYRQGVTNSVSQTSLNILDRFMNVPPTFTVREGTRIKVYLTKPLELPAYNEHRATPSVRRNP